MLQKTESQGRAAAVPWLVSRGSKRGKCGYLERETPGRGNSGAKTTRVKKQQVTRLPTADEQVVRERCRT